MKSPNKRAYDYFLIFVSDQILKYNRTEFYDQDIFYIEDMEAMIKRDETGLYHCLQGSIFFLFSIKC